MVDSPPTSVPASALAPELPQNLSSVANPDSSSSDSTPHPSPNPSPGSTRDRGRSRDRRQKLIRSIREYTPGEEVANSVTHGIGALLGVVSLVAMILVSVQAGSGIVLFSTIVFGATLVLEYTNSTLYHALTNPRAKKVFKVLDHSSIYMLIAGTYTPYCLIALAGHGGIVVVAIVWGIAVVGIATEAFWVFRPRWSAALIYLAMGWMIIFKAVDLFAVVPQGALVMLLAGGACYTLGIVFYLLKKIKFMHSIWHLWTIAGSAFHVIGVLFYLL